MWRSGGTKPASGSAEARRAPSRLRGPLHFVLTLAVVAAIVVFLFPVVFGARIDVPAEVQFGSASSMTFRISNQNLTPLSDVTYSCEVSQLTLANGTPIKDANVLNRGETRKIAGRRAAAGRCQTGYLVTAPLQTAEYKLTISYRAYPWPQIRTSVSRIAARINGKGEVTGWKLE
jgi:hypothetical protein